MNLTIIVKNETVTPIIVYDGDYYLGRCEEYPSVVTQGYSFENVIRNITEAAELVIETMKCSRCMHWDEGGCMQDWSNGDCDFLSTGAEFEVDK